MRGRLSQAFKVTIFSLISFIIFAIFLIYLAGKRQGTIEEMRGTGIARETENAATLAALEAESAVAITDAASETQATLAAQAEESTAAVTMVMAEAEATLAANSESYEEVIAALETELAPHREPIPTPYPTCEEIAAVAVQNAENVNETLTCEFNFRSALRPGDPVKANSEIVQVYSVELTEDDLTCLNIADMEQVALISQYSNVELRDNRPRTIVGTIPGRTFDLTLRVPSPPLTGNNAPTYYGCWQINIDGGRVGSPLLPIIVNVIPDDQ